MHERSDGAFTLVVQGQGGPPDRAAVGGRAPQRAARAIEGGRAGAIQRASPTVAYVQISTPLENEDAAKQTPKLREAIGTVPGAKTYLTGYPALNHDTQPIYNDDLSTRRVDRGARRDPRDGLHVRHASAGSSCRSSSRS